MKAAAVTQCSTAARRNSAILHTFLLANLFIALLATNAKAATQILLQRGGLNDQPGQYSGVVDLTIDPGFDNAKVTVTVDGQKVADGLMSPYHLVVDLGPTPLQHRISISAKGANGKHVRWTETINRGLLPLALRVKAMDTAAGLFEVDATSPADDPIEVVQLWDQGQVIATTSEAPYRFTVPPSILASGFVQVTARTKAGEEAADFWSAAGNVHVAELQVRTVPIFVSVVDRNGVTHDNVDRALFRIMDGNSEGTIIEFGKAFDQPISIALLVDSSASMTYSMKHAAKAAGEFVKHALKDGDRCSITAVQDVPRRKQPLTDDRAQIAAALAGITPLGRTALYDAVASAIRELREEKNRRAIVVLTDGSDTTSTWSYDEVEKLSREAAIPIYFIAYEGGSDDDAARNLERLRYLASQTGGFVATATEQNLMAKYTEIEKDLRAQFAITYQVSDFGKTNEWRPVRVVVNSPKLTARTIKGYFTP
ncbi:MAG TPA: VWA domain-containing protein [Thermoanaerobaculia bacterium]|nr:VWA domain-containing protein [Thermoanaerobaculia bacterium]